MTKRSALWCLISLSIILLVGLVSTSDQFLDKELADEEQEVVIKDLKDGLKSATPVSEIDEYENLNFEEFQNDPRVHPYQLNSFRAALNDDSALLLPTNAMSSHGFRKQNIYPTHDIKVMFTFSNNLKKRFKCDQSRALNNHSTINSVLSFLRIRLMSKYNLKPEFSLSLSFVYFYVYYEKINFLLEMLMKGHLKGPVTAQLHDILRFGVDYGLSFQSVMQVIEKHGVVPTEIQPDTSQSLCMDITMFEALNMLVQNTFAEFRFRQGHAAKPMTLDQMRARKQEVLQKAYRILRIGLGDPPKTFAWGAEKRKPKEFVVLDSLTPLKFYQEHGAKLGSEFVTLFNHPSQALNQLYEFPAVQGVLEAQPMRALNVPVDCLKKTILKVLKDKRPVYMHFIMYANQVGDASGVLLNPQSEYKTIFGIDCSMSREDKILYAPSRAIASGVITGYNIDSPSDEPNRWCVESAIWTTAPEYEGYLSMSDEFLEKFVVSISVPEKYLEADLVSCLEQEPIVSEPIRNYQI